jgi:hypothetical protein
VTPADIGDPTLLRMARDSYGWGLPAMVSRSRPSARDADSAADGRVEPTGLIPHNARTTAEDDPAWRSGGSWVQVPSTPPLFPAGNSSGWFKACGGVAVTAWQRTSEWDTGRFSCVTVSVAACVVTDPPPSMETARNSQPFMKLRYGGGIRPTPGVCHCGTSLHAVPPTPATHCRCRRAASSRGERDRDGFTRFSRSNASVPATLCATRRDGQERSDLDDHADIVMIFSPDPHPQSTAPPLRS